MKPSLVFQAIWGFLFYKHYPLPITFDFKTISTNPNYIKKATNRAKTNMKVTLFFYFATSKIK